MRLPARGTAVIRRSGNKLALSAAARRVLAALPDDPAAAVGLETLTPLLPKRHSAAHHIRKLLHWGYVDRREYVAPHLKKYLYWRTPEGAERMGAPLPELNDDPSLLSPRNTTRGAVTFRDAMAACGLDSLESLYGLDLAARRLFEQEWSQRMYAACEAAGEPIPEQATKGQGMLITRASRMARLFQRAG